MSTPPQQANGETSHQALAHTRNSAAKSLLVPFLIALSLALVGVGALSCLEGDQCNLFSSPDLFSEDSTLYRLATTTLGVFIVLGFLAMVAILALWLRFPAEAYSALSTEIAAKLLPGDASQVELSKLASGLGIGAAVTAVFVSVSVMVTVNVAGVARLAETVNDAAKSTHESMNSITESLDALKSEIVNVEPKWRDQVGRTIESAYARQDSALGDLSDAVREVADGQIGREGLESVMGKLEGRLALHFSRIGESLGPLQRQADAMAELDSSSEDLAEQLSTQASQYTIATQGLEQHFHGLEELGKSEAEYRIKGDKRHLLRRAWDFIVGREEK